MLAGSDYTMNNLFAQLGLDNSEEEINEFIRKNQLAKGESLKNATIWNDSQRVFLKEEWHKDGPWADVIDDLNLLLHPTI